MTTAFLTANPVLAAADDAVRAIPPLFPLSSSVAVNPFLGQAGEPLAVTASRLARIGGVRLMLPRAVYAAKIAAGTITDADLEAALEASIHAPKPASVAAVKASAHEETPAPKAVPTVAHLAAHASGIDWPAIIADRIGAWAGAYFDQGQALWPAPKAKGAFAAWRAFAMQDLSVEIAGLDGFATHIADGPETAAGLITRASATLRLDAVAAQSYFHQLLAGIGGWSQYARYLLWQAELVETGDETARDMLAIRLVFEEALAVRYGEAIKAGWADALAAHRAPIAPNADQVVDAILQEAAERAAQRQLAATLAADDAAPVTERPVLQAAFCIDVRSEVFRRALESVDPAIETLGFAGFFGLDVSHRRFGSDVAEARLPVLLRPQLTSVACDVADDQADLKARVAARTKRAWGRFKLAAVSSFAFVEAAGPLYIAKLVRDGLALKPTPMPLDPAPVVDASLSPEAKLGAAEAVLRAMSLTSNFGRIVMLAGHGARVVNNPHQSALHCGACGGYSGEVNARLLALLLNEPNVRRGLAQRGILVPSDTLFIAALHDTTGDEVHLYDGDISSVEHAADLERVQGWLAAAGRLARTERALKLPGAAHERDVAQRTRNWAEVRPEWGPAGCKAFIAAPRHRTSGRSLGGQAFLHSYDWRQDKDFGVLELILTAPVVVASWISLQYYGSAVAPEMFGGGNKLLHNVVGGLGVIEGNGGALKPGLPWQSVHDGETLMHEPLRLSVVIEAPREAMTAILDKHPGVRALFDNGWLSLFAMDASGMIAWRYAGAGSWVMVDPAAEPATVRSVA